MFRNTLLSALAFYKYDDTVFDGFRVPTDPAGIDRDTCIDNILYQTAELSLAMDSSPEMFKQHVRLWTNKNFAVWQHLWETMNYDYNPIWNADYTERDRTVLDGQNVNTPNTTVTDNFNRNLKEVQQYDRNLQENDTYTPNLKDTSASDSTHNIAAYNNGLSTDWTQHDSGTVDHTGKSTNDISQTGDTKTTTDQTGNTSNTTTTQGSTTDKRDDTTTFDKVLQGNYGQTTTQQMINEEREIALFNLIDYITDDFKNEFCIQLY